jgi:O-acetyl-ADP-ribose deacetylase (regulator of RNase III)
MIKEVSGDILLSNAQVMAHGVAPNDTFTSGLAQQLRTSWPSMYMDFRHFCQSNHPKAGGLWAWMGADGKRVVNLFTQEAAYHAGEKPGRATLQHIGHALKALRPLIETEKFTSVALTRLATGVGGLHWNDVKPLLFQNLDFRQRGSDVYVEQKEDKGHFQCAGAMP